MDAPSAALPVPSSAVTPAVTARNRSVEQVDRTGEDGFADLVADGADGTGERIGVAAADVPDAAVVLPTRDAADARKPALSPTSVAAEAPLAVQPLAVPSTRDAPASTAVSDASKPMGEADTPPTQVARSDGSETATGSTATGYLGASATARTGDQTFRISASTIGEARIPQPSKGEGGVATPPATRGDASPMVPPAVASGQGAKASHIMAEPLGLRADQAATVALISPGASSNRTPVTDVPMVLGLDPASPGQPSVHPSTDAARGVLPEERSMATTRKPSVPGALAPTMTEPRIALPKSSSQAPDSPGRPVASASDVASPDMVDLKRADPNVREPVPPVRLLATPSAAQVGAQTAAALPSSDRGGAVFDMMDGSADGMTDPRAGARPLKGPTTPIALTTAPVPVAVSTPPAAASVPQASPVHSPTGATPSLGAPPDQGTVPFVGLKDAATSAAPLLMFRGHDAGIDPRDMLREGLPTRTGVDITARVGPGRAGWVPQIASIASAPPPARHQPGEGSFQLAELSTKAGPEHVLPGTAAPAAAPAAALSTAAPTTAPFAGSGTAIPHHIAQHIAASLPKPVSDLGNGTLEIALDPPELGRVRMSLVEIGGTLTLSITAERAETAELMRRHMDILNQEFSRSGLDAPDVHVGTGAEGHGGPPGRDEGGQTGQAGPSGTPETDVTLASATHSTARGEAVDPTRALDLRL